MDAKDRLDNLRTFVHREGIGPEEVPGQGAAAKGLRMLLEAACQDPSVWDRVTAVAAERDAKLHGVGETLRRANGLEHGTPGGSHQDQPNQTR